MADSETTQATPAPAVDADSRKVKIERVEHSNGPAICIPYEDGSGQMQLWYPDAALQKFEVKAIIAAAAVASGHFQESTETKTKLKKSDS